MKLDLSDMGIEVEPVSRSTYRLNAQRLAADAARVAAAVEELRDAWEALPPAVRKKLGKVVLTMHDGTEEDGA